MCAGMVQMFSQGKSTAERARRLCAPTDTNDEKRIPSGGRVVLSLHTHIHPSKQNHGGRGERERERARTRAREGWEANLVDFVVPLDSDDPDVHWADVCEENRNKQQGGVSHTKGTSHL